VSTTQHDPVSILQVLDTCCGRFTFPGLDNGYVYLAASRLSLHRSENDWSLVIEIFGYSPRVGLPYVHVQTFGSRLHDRNKPEDYVTSAAYQAYLANNPHNESRFFYPIEEGSWIDQDEPEKVSPSGTVTLRGTALGLPSAELYRTAKIELEGERPSIFELCRFLAYHHREQVLATDLERRTSVPPELTEILVLEDWHHPDVCAAELPSKTETFRELAEVLAHGDIARYRTTEERNTHWRNWPEGGTL
jgi:hypothetical protein